MTLQVTRYSFFKTIEGTLRFTEHVPPKAECDHPICNCTKNVSTRPIGTPSEVTQSIRLTPLQLGRLSTEFGLENGWLTFRWEMTPEDIAKCIYDADRRDPHAYFMFNPNQRSVRLEIMVPGYGLTDYFFADLYLGNEIDVSRFINGHSPSKIVNLAGCSHTDLWLHKCNWGVERVRVLSNGEADAWRDTFSLMEKLNHLMKKYKGAAIHWPIEDVWADVNSNLEIFETAHRVADFCEQIVLELPTTQLFHLQREIDQELKDAHA